MKTFKTFAKAWRYVLLWIEGSYGEGFTLSDIIIDKQLIKDCLRYAGKSIVVIRETGAQGGFQDSLSAKEYADKWRNSVGTITFTQNENKEIEIQFAKL